MTKEDMVAFYGFCKQVMGLENQVGQLQKRIAELSVEKAENEKPA